MTIPWRSVRSASVVLAAVALAGVVGLAGPVPARPAAAAACPAGAAGALAPVRGAAAAHRLASRCGQRVEIAEQGTERAQVFANPDGTSTLQASAVPRRVRRPDGSWAAVPPAAAVPVASGPVASGRAAAGPAGGAQPNNQVSGRNRWGYANSSNSNNNDGIARVGVDPGGDGTYRSYFEFPVGAAVGSRILAVSMNTTLIHSWSCGNTPVSVWESDFMPAGVNGTRTGTWAASPQLRTYLDQRSGHAHKPSTGAGCGDDPQPDQPMQFFSATMTTKQQQWATANVTSITFALSAGDSNLANEGATDRWKKFSPGATVLVVQFNHAPGTPGPAALSAVGTSQTVGCWVGDVAGQPRVNATGGLHLRATLTDADAGDNVLARFEWQDVTGGAAVVAVPDTPGFPSGHTYDVAVAAASLPDGHGIRWRVHGWDGRDNGGASAWCQLAVDNSTPGQPTLDSTDLPPFPANPPAGTVTGAPAVVTATPAPDDTDIAGYYVGVGAVDTVPTTWVPAAPGGTATIPVVPVVSGIAKNFLTVVAVDAAGNRSPVPVSAPNEPGTRQFRANPGTGARTRGDLTGDGLADIAGLLDAGNGQTKLVNFDTATGGAAVLTPSTPIVTDPNAFPVSKLVGVRGDFDGDGRADIAAFRDDGGCRATLWRWLSTGNSYVPANAPLWDSGAGNWCVANAPKVVAGDFTGDGKDDIGAFYSYPSNRVALFVWPAAADGTGFTARQVWWDSGVGNWEYSHFTAGAGDVNGDGKDDIVQLYDYNSCSTAVFVFTSSGTGVAWPVRPWRSANNEWCWASMSKPLVGDVDGDGTDDISTVYNLGNGSWQPLTIFGPGASAVRVTSAVAHTRTVPGRIKPAMADYDGDGLADIALLSNDGPTATTVWVANQLGAFSNSFSTETVRWDSATAGGLSWSAFTPL
jgi:hypothetical protein